MGGGQGWDVAERATGGSGKDASMDWFGGGWPVVLLGLACVALAMIWLLDRRRMESLCRQIRLRAEAESDRLRLRISALKPVEARVLDLQTELAGLRPSAARVPDLEDRIVSLQASVAERDSTTVELEREAAGLRARLTDVEELEAEAVESAARNAELGQELAVATERLVHLERVDAQLTASREEIGRLSKRLETAVQGERELSREVGTLTEAVARYREQADLAESRAAAAEDLIARRDDIILVLERRLADREGGAVEVDSGDTGSGEAGAGDTAASGPSLEAAHDLPAGIDGPPAGRNGTANAAASDAASAEREAKRRRKEAKAERKRAKKRAKRMQEAAKEAAAKEAAERADVAPSNGEPVDGDPADVEHDLDADSGSASFDGVGNAGERPEAIAAGSDDLQVINGIGPVMERTLNDLGIRRFDQLAALDEAGAAELSSRLPGLPGRVERDGWVDQARAELQGDSPEDGD